MSSPISSGEDINYTLDDDNIFYSIETNFSYNVLTEDQDPNSDVNYNFKEYDLFCLKTKMIRFIPKSMDISFTSKLHSSDKMYMYLNLISLSDDTNELDQFNVSLFENKFNEMLDLEPSNAVLFSMNEVSPYQAKFLEYIDIDDQYEMFIYQNMLFVNLENEVEYKKKYVELQQDILDQLNSLEKSGGVITSQSMADKWGLLLYKNLDNEYTDYNIYYCGWTDPNIAPNLVEFTNNLVDKNINYFIFHFDLPEEKKEEIIKKIKVYGYDLESDYLGFKIIDSKNNLNIDDLMSIKLKIIESI